MKKIDFQFFLKISKILIKNWKKIFFTIIARIEKAYPKYKILLFPQQLYAVRFLRERVKIKNNFQIIYSSEDTE